MTATQASPTQVQTAGQGFGSPATLYVLDMVSSRCRAYPGVCSSFLYMQEPQEQLLGF